MKELSQVWGQLTDVSQANILNLVGGKRNGNVVAALLNNFSIAEDVMKTAAESAGSAMAENEKYLDSIAGKIAVLKSSFEELSFDMIDSSWVKGAVEFATALVNIVDSLAKIDMILPAIVSSVIVIKSMKAFDRNAAMQAQEALAIESLSARLVEENGMTATLRASYISLNAEMRESVIERYKVIAASEGVTSAQIEETVAKLKAASATNAVDAANKKLSVSSRALASITPFGWVGIALSLLPALLSLYERLHKSNDELIQDAKELEDSFASSMSKTVSEIDQIKGLRGEFDELSKGVSDYGKNISLSADEYERYQKIVQTIVGISPSLIEGYDAENKAIVNKNGLIERTIELLEYERKLKLDEYLSDENIITSGKGVVAGINEFIGKGANPYTGEYWADGLLGQMADMAQSKIDSGAVSAIDISGAFGLGDAMRRYATMGGPMVERFFEEYYDQIKDAVYNRNEELRSVFTEEEIDTLEHILQEHDKNVEKYEAELDRRRAGFNPTLQLAAQDAEGYEKLSEAQKSFVSSYVDTFRLDEDDGEDVFKKQRDDVVAFTEALLENEDALKAIEVGNIITTGKGADGKSLTIDEYRKQLRSFIQYVESIEDPELRVRIVSQYGTSGDDAGIDEAINLAREKLKAVLSGEDADSTAIENFINNLTVDEAVAIAYELKARDGSMTVEEIEEWLRERKQAIIHLELSESFNAAYDKMKELYDMRDKLKDLAADGSDLDIDTFVELSKLLPEVIGGITDVASAQEALKQKIRDSQHDVVNAYGGMVLANDEFIAGVLSNNKALADHMATYYNNDLSRFQEISKGKYAVDQALVQSLSELWAKYSKVSTADIESEINYLKNYVFPQMSKLDNGADNSPAYAQSMQDLRNRLKEAETMLAWRKEIEDKWDELSRTTKSSSSSGKEVDAYIVDIDRYREALERLNNIRINKEDLEQALSATDDLDEKIRLEQELLSVYQAEQATLLEINRLRDQTILEGVDKLTKMGFQVDYDPENDKLFVRNMERINELAASSKGKYGSLQEATNALRKDTEELIETLENLNRENQDGTDDWQALEQSVRDAKVNIVNNLKEVVTQASDAVDAIQGVYDTLKEAADEYAANGGFISVDTFQKIIELGPEYMQYLRDENNQLVINEESINRVIAAKTRQLALEQAMSYVARIRMALESGSVENLNTLLYATTETTNATWGLVYAELELMHVTGALNDQQYAAALHNIQAIQSLGENAAQNIGRVTGSVVEELNKMKSGLDDLLKYVMDMLRDKIKRQIEDLEEMKDAYADLIAMKKESLEKTDQETKYQDKVAKKVREIQKLQEKINALSLDDSRDAAAQKLKLEEEMAKLQEELAEMQSDNALEIQQDSLDKMQEAYEGEKDKEIEALEDSISSEQKLYDMAIQYIKDNWDDLLSTLTDWNYEYGSSLTSEITTAWENALAAAQKYGDYVTALEQIDADIEQAGGGQSGGSGGIGGNIIVGDTVPPSKPTDEDRVGAIIRQMYRNSKAWNSADKAGKDALNEENRKLGEVDLKRYGITAVRGDDGVWYVDRVGGERLFDRYRKYIDNVYHSGGIVGDVGSLKENELLATMERGEVVVSNRNKDALFSLLDFANLLSKKMDMTGYGPYASVPFSDVRPDISDVVTNNAENIHFGDVYIYGANEDTVEKHREINRQFTNDILRQLNIKK